MHTYTPHTDRYSHSNTGAHKCAYLHKYERKLNVVTAAANRFSVGPADFVSTAVGTRAAAEGVDATQMT